MAEKILYGDGTMRPINATTKPPSPPTVTLRDPVTAETMQVDARLGCVVAGVKYRRAPGIRLTTDEINLGDLTSVGRVPGGGVYLEDPTGGWRYLEIVPSRSSTT